VFDYSALVPGSQLVGPAIVESPFTTVVLPPASTLSVDEYLNLVILP
jgi:N-methylhydantoinase A/oxoprolinase/acetone carboxylase beta subunit